MATNGRRRLGATMAASRVCNVCERKRTQVEFMVVLSSKEVRCRDATVWANELERQLVAGVERFLFCSRCRGSKHIREVRVVLPTGAVRCIDGGDCRRQDGEGAA